MCRSRWRGKFAGSTRAAPCTVPGSRLHPAALQWSCYREIPALSKKEIVERGHHAFFADHHEVDRALREKRYEYESTSGTTSGPMTVIMEAGWWEAQTERAYRASPILRQFVGRKYRKCVLAPVGCSSNLCPYEDHPFPHRYFDGTVYLNLSSDPFSFPEAEWDRIVVELQATQPEVLEGEPVYLSLLARAVKKRGVSVPSIRAVILTYGKASRQHGRRIAEAFPAPQVDLYGSTEAGYLFVGEAFRDDSRVIDANAFIELAPWRRRASGRFPNLRHDPGSRGDAASALSHGRHRPAARDRLPDPWPRERPVFPPRRVARGGERRGCGAAGRLRLLALPAGADRRPRAGIFTTWRTRPRTTADSRPRSAACSARARA